MSEAEQSDGAADQDKKDEKDETGVLVEKVKAGDAPVTELTDYLDLADVKSFDVKLTDVVLEKVKDSQGRNGYLLLGDVGQKEQATTGRILICSLYLAVEEGSDANPILFIAELDASTLFKEIPFAGFLGLDDPGLVRLQVIALARHALKTGKEVDDFNKAIQEKLSGKTKSAPPTLMKKTPDKKAGGAAWEPGVYLALGTSLGKEDVPGLTLRLKKLAKSEPTTAAEESPKANARRWPIRGYGLKYLPEIPAADGVPGAPAVVRMTIDAGFAYGPLGLEVIGFGLQVPFKTSDLVDFVTLTGIGVRADFAGFTVDGAVMWDQEARRRGIWKFDGLIAVTIPELLTFVLAGSYAQVSNPGEPTYNSLFVFVSLSDFVLPLGPVTITGFMLGGGFNSLLRMPKIDDIENFPFVSGLKSGRVLAPKAGEKADKQESAAEVLRKLSSADESGWVSPCDGRHWGAGGLKLELCEVVKCDALLVVEFGHGVAVVLLGVVKFEPLPKQDDKPSKLEIVKLVVQFEIGYDFDRHLLLCAFALTQDCFLLAKECKLSGGGALYVYTGGPSGGQWVLALGGYNPGFKVPKSYPKVPRIALEASLCDSVLIRGEFYFAKTTDGIMAGMACSISEDGGWWRWWCSLHWDLWVEWHSFSLRFDVGVSLGISASINLGLFRVPVSIEIGVDISLWWLPEHGGHCEVHLWGLSIGGGWGVSWPETKEQPKVPWTKFTRQLPKAVKVVRKKGVERGEPKDEVTHLSAVVAAGEAPGGGKPGDGGTATVPDQPWVFSQAGFEFTTDTAMPVTHLKINGVEVPDTGIPNSGSVNLRPMGEEGSGATSHHCLTIDKLRDGTTDQWEPYDVLKNDWAVAPVRTSVPRSLFGPSGETSNDAANNTDEGLVHDQPTGLKVTVPGPEADGDPVAVFADKLAIEDLHLTGNPENKVLPVVNTAPSGPKAHRGGTTVRDDVAKDLLASSARRGAVTAVLTAAGLPFDDLDDDLGPLAAAIRDLYTDPPLLVDARGH